MRIEGFAARADIVGRRIAVSWDVVPGEGETLADAPVLTLRRKERDFEFPPPGAGDPFLVYASTAFPPAGARVTEIDLGADLAAGLRTVTLAESVSLPVSGREVEVLRRTRTTTFAPDGTAVRRHETVLDVDRSAAGLTPRTTYYYELDVPNGVEVPATTGPPRASATATDAHGSGRTLYELLPAVHRRHDVVTPPPADTGAVPEAVAVNGQLRRFMDVFGAAADHLRSRADGLRDLHDVDTVDARLLPHLAGWLGWDLTVAAPIPVQRHEIRYAAQLYRITGTLPGCTLWAKRLTDWDVEVQEMWRTVLVTNDLGNPDDPRDRGSRTVDTADPQVLAAIGTADDVVDYSYETGPQARHAFNVVTFHATPGPGETLEEIRRKRGRLLDGTEFFLPFNLHAALELPEPVLDGGATTVLGLTDTTDQGV
jgi:phage tail-like protein